MVNQDDKRVYAGFRTLEFGNSGGLDPELIGDNQCSLAGEFSFRGGLLSTRPPFVSYPLAYDSTSVETNFTGKFQGAMFYEAYDDSDNSILLSLGGRLFRIWVNQNNKVTEITPQIPVSIAADFTVPAVNSAITVDVTSEVPFALGDVIHIDSGHYTVLGKLTLQLQLLYTGSAANTTVSEGQAVLDSSDNQVIYYITNPDFFDFVFLYQAEHYAIILASQQKTIIFDGASCRAAAPDELPSGYIGVYSWGRNWIALSDERSFVAGDLVGSSSGSPGNSYVDAILKMTENTYLNGGGSFKVPNNGGIITAMQNLSTLDSSLGIGPMLVGTNTSFCSVQAPVDRTTWQNLTYPIQTIALMGSGPMGPRHCIPANNDIWFRASDGIRSFIAARRDLNFNRGNTPMDFEVSPITRKDEKNLLFYGSSAYFDNRLLTTVGPSRTEYGVIHQGLLSMNFDTISGLQQKNPPIWEGIFSGMDILQIISGQIYGEDHCYVLGLNNGTVQVWELLKENSGYYDSVQTGTNPDVTITRTSIQPWVETKAYDFGISNLKQIIMAEVVLDHVVDDVSIVVKYRPDGYPAWNTWATANMCATVSQCSIVASSGATCSVWSQGTRQYAAKVKFPRPTEMENAISGLPMDQGYRFQFRLEGTGNFRIRSFRVHALKVREEMEGSANAGNPECQFVENCDTNYFDYTITT